MEAPEKIYLVNDDLNIKREWYKTKQVGFETTEYTRTDVLIERACKYLEPNVKIILCGDKIDTDKFIEDFVKYMKGE